jgi:hypothetical protein
MPERMPFRPYVTHRELRAILEGQEKIMADLTALNAAVAQLQTTTAEVVTALGSSDDTAGIAAATAAITTATDDLAAAIAPPAPPAPDPTPAVATSLYTFSGDPTTIDATVWPLAAVETDAVPPVPLYTYSGDTAPGEANGNGLDGGAWALYTGTTQPVVA